MDLTDGGRARRRKLHVYADTLRLTREERIELSEMILRRDIASWKDLDDGQVGRMLDALEGAVLVIHMRTRGHDGDG